MSGARRSSTGIDSSWLVFAAVLMIFGGLTSLFAGISTIANDGVFDSARNYFYTFDLTGWGWIHLITGGVITLAGFALFQGATWARVVGVGLARPAILANFLWLPARRSGRPP